MAPFGEEFSDLIVVYEAEEFEKLIICFAVQSKNNEWNEFFILVSGV